MGCGSSSSASQPSDKNGAPGKTPPKITTPDDAPTITTPADDQMNRCSVAVIGGGISEVPRESERASYARRGSDGMYTRWEIEPALTVDEAEVDPVEAFEAACAKWIQGELEPGAEENNFEYWQDFQSRVYTAIDEIMAKHGSGSRVLISTSGGVIAMVLQRVLQFPDQAVITTNWMVRNSSVSRVKYGQGKVSLTQFNSLPHLERSGLQEMITYR